MPHAGILIAPWLLFLAFAAPAAAQVNGPPRPQPSGADHLTLEERGDLAMIHQEYVAAIEFYRQGPQNSADIWNKLGMAWHHLFAMDAAKRDYEHALRLRPEYPQALNNLGAVYYSQKNYRKAVRYYRKALALDQSSATMYSNLGTAYFAEQKFQDGLAAYQKAFALDPGVFNDADHLNVSEPLPASGRAQQDYCIARIFAQSGKTSEALDFLRRALDEGFEDRGKLFRDQTLASVRGTPEFAQLMSEEQLR
ncbi:MAG TPA: tetratricopeptide repeat protein [Acidobacteriaceae bacterium]|nr:tetratricopeptide repeat protein [Acidobacteriaceae bacterium]